jgi:hypothetical protein
VAVPPLEPVRGGLPAELARRERHDHAPEVLFLDCEGRAPGLPNGGILVVSGHERSELVLRAQTAARTGDQAAIRRILKAPSAAQPDLAGALGAMHPIVQVSYHGMPIAEGMVLPEPLGAIRVVLPFAGGALDRDGFTASAYVAAGAAAPALATLVILREPKLSDFERRALDRVPGQMSRMAIGHGLDSGTSLGRLVELRAELMLAGRLK